MLGVDGVVAESFARIHFANLINFGVVPPMFAEDGVYERLEEGDELEIVGDVADQVHSGAKRVTVDVSGEWTFEADVDLTDDERETLVVGGKLSQLKRED